MQFHNVNRQQMGEGVYGPEVYRHSLQIDAASLLGQVMVPRMGEVDRGYQRPLSQKDVLEVANLLRAGGNIMGLISLVLHPENPSVWDRKAKRLEFELPPERPLEVLDGQHRLLGAFRYIKELQEEGKDPPRLPVRVDLYTGMDRVSAAKLFQAIGGTQRAISRTHLAELAHMTGLEQGEVREASDIYDELLEGPLAPPEGKKPKVARPTFVKAAVPLVSSAGVLRGLSAEDRSLAIVLYFEACQEVLGDQLQKSAVVGALCDVYADVLQGVDRSGPITKEKLEEALTPLKGFQLKDLDRRGRSAVAEHFKGLVGFRLNVSFA